MGSATLLAGSVLGVLLSLGVGDAKKEEIMSKENLIIIDRQTLVHSFHFNTITSIDYTI